MEPRIILLPYKMRFIAVALLICAGISAYLYFYGGRPEFFNIKIFAIISVYLETRYFVIAQTNILDELAAILFLTSILTFSFSKLKSEKTEYNSLRINALICSIFITSVFGVLSVLLIYGMAVFLVSSSLFFFFLISYNVIFYYLVFKNRRINSGLNN